MWLNCVASPWPILQLNLYEKRTGGEFLHACKLLQQETFPMEESSRNSGSKCWQETHHQRKTLHTSNLIFLQLSDIKASHISMAELSSLSLFACDVGLSKITVSTEKFLLSAIHLINLVTPVQVNRTIDKFWHSIIKASNSANPSSENVCCSMFSRMNE